MDIASNFSLNTFIDLTEQELGAKRFIPALFMALTIPDICNGKNTKKKKYIRWFNRWVVCGNPKPIIDGSSCYDIRCGMLHSGTTDKPFSLSCDSKNNLHLGHAVSVMTDNSGKEELNIKININELVESIIMGARAFISEKGDIKLFRLIDYGKIEINS